MQNRLTNSANEYHRLIQEGNFIDVTKEALAAGLQTTTLLAEKLYNRLLDYKVDLNRLFSLLIVAIMQSDGHTFNIKFPGPLPNAPDLCGKLLCDDSAAPILTISYAD